MPHIGNSRQFAFGCFGCCVCFICIILFASNETSTVEWLKIRRRIQLADFWRIFGAQKLGGEFGYRRRLGASNWNFKKTAN